MRRYVDLEQRLMDEFGLGMGSKMSRNWSGEEWKYLELTTGEIDLEERLKLTTYRLVLLERFLYLFNGLRIENATTFGGAHAASDELEKIIGREILKEFELSYDFLHNRFCCFLNGKQSEIAKWTTALMSTENEQNYPKAIKMKLLFTSKGEKEKIIRMEIETRLNRLIKENGFEDYFFKELPELIVEELIKRKQEKEKNGTEEN